VSLKFAIDWPLLPSYQKIWDSTSNNEIIVYGLRKKDWTDKRVRQNIAYLVHDPGDFFCLSVQQSRVSTVIVRPLSTVGYMSVASVSTVDSGLTNLINDRCKL